MGSAEMVRVLPTHRLRAFLTDSRPIALRFVPIVSGIEEAVDGLSDAAIEGSNRCERHMDEAMFARSFHQLSHTFRVVQVHDHIKTLCASYSNDLTGLWEHAIRFDDNSRYSGTH
jgi:hypothetical protein